MNLQQSEITQFKQSLSYYINNNIHAENIPLINQTSTTSTIPTTSTTSTTGTSTSSTTNPHIYHATSTSTEIEDKYDRQIRLWGECGQNNLNTSTILCFNASTCMTEFLRNLVLPSIHSFHIVDDQIVTEYDLETNFFLNATSINKSRSRECVITMTQLNPSVSGFSHQLNPTQAIHLIIYYFTYNPINIDKKSIQADMIDSIDTDILHNISPNNDTEFLSCHQRFLLLVAFISSSLMIIDCSNIDIGTVTLFDLLCRKYEKKLLLFNQQGLCSSVRISSPSFFTLNSHPSFVNPVYFTQGSESIQNHIYPSHGEYGIPLTHLRLSPEYLFPDLMGQDASLFNLAIDNIPHNSLKILQKYSTELNNRVYSHNNSQFREIIQLYQDIKYNILCIPKSILLFCIGLVGIAKICTTQDSTTGRIVQIIHLQPYITEENKLMIYNLSQLIEHMAQRETNEMTIRLECETEIDILTETTIVTEENILQLFSQVYSIPKYTSFEQLCLSRSGFPIIAFTVKCLILAYHETIYFLISHQSNIHPRINVTIHQLYYTIFHLWCHEICWKDITIPQNRNFESKLCRRDVSHLTSSSETLPSKHDFYFLHQEHSTQLEFPEEYKVIAKNIASNQNLSTIFNRINDNDPCVDITSNIYNSYNIYVIIPCVSTTLHSVDTTMTSSSTMSKVLYQQHICKHWKLEDDVANSLADILTFSELSNGENLYQTTSTALTSNSEEATLDEDNKVDDVCNIRVDINIKQQKLSTIQTMMISKVRQFNTLFVQQQKQRDQQQTHHISENHISGITQEPSNTISSISNVQHSNNNLSQFSKNDIMTADIVKYASLTTPSSIYLLTTPQRHTFPSQSSLYIIFFVLKVWIYTTNQEQALLYIQQQFTQQRFTQQQFDSSHTGGNTSNNLTIDSPVGVDISLTSLSTKICRPPPIPSKFILPDLICNSNEYTSLKKAYTAASMSQSWLFIELVVHIIGYMYLLSHDAKYMGNINSHCREDLNNQANTKEVLNTCFTQYLNNETVEILEGMSQRNLELVSNIMQHLHTFTSSLERIFFNRNYHTQNVQTSQVLESSHPFHIPHTSTFLTSSTDILRNPILYFLQYVEFSRYQQIPTLFEEYYSYKPTSSLNLHKIPAMNIKKGPNGVVTNHKSSLLQLHNDHKEDNQPGPSNTHWYLTLQAVNRLFSYIYSEYIRNIQKYYQQKTPVVLSHPVIATLYSLKPTITQQDQLDSSQNCNIIMQELCLYDPQNLLSTWNSLLSTYINDDSKTLQQWITNIYTNIIQYELDLLEQIPIDISCCKEISRYLMQQLHTQSSITGAIGSEIALKLLTKQFIVPNNTVVLNGIFGIFSVIA